MANFSAIVAARKDRLPEDFLKGSLYVSEHVHASVTKAAMLAGFPVRHVRSVAADPVAPDGRRRAPARDRRGPRERARSRSPSSRAAGTTNTGAVDPIDAIADVAEPSACGSTSTRAYGGFFQLTDRGRERFRGHRARGLDHARPAQGHVPVLRDGRARSCATGRKLRDAHHIGTSAYLQDLAADAEVPNFTEYSAELSRDFRGLRVWFPLQLHGVAAFREALDEKLDLAEHLYESLKAIPELELPWQPELTVVPFRLRTATTPANRAFLATDQRDRARRTSRAPCVDGRFTIRACILSHRTHRDRIDECIEIVRRAAAGGIAVDELRTERLVLRVRG